MQNSVNNSYSTFMSTNQSQQYLDAREPNLPKDDQEHPLLAEEMGEGGEQGGGAAGGNAKSSTKAAAEGMSQMPITHCCGLVWCILQGLTRGAMYSGQKVAHEVTGV